MRNQLIFVLYAVITAFTCGIFNKASANTVEFCNKYPAKIYLAVGYRNFDYTTTSDGWYGLEPGACHSFSNIISSQFFYYAESHDEVALWLNRGKTKKWRGSSSFCAHPTNKFTYTYKTGTEKECANRLRMSGFNVDEQYERRIFYEKNHSDIPLSYAPILARDLNGVREWENRLKRNNGRENPFSLGIDIETVKNQKITWYQGEFSKGEKLYSVAEFLDFSHWGWGNAKTPELTLAQKWVKLVLDNARVVDFVEDIHNPYEVIGHDMATGKPTQFYNASDRLMTVSSKISESGKPVFILSGVVDGGVLITNVGVGMPAADTSIEVGDIITRLNGQKISNAQDYHKAMSQIEFDFDELLPIQIIREGETINGYIEPRFFPFNHPLYADSSPTLTAIWQVLDSIPFLFGNEVACGIVTTLEEGFQSANNSHAVRWDWVKRERESCSQSLNRKQELYRVLHADAAVAGDWASLLVGGGIIAKGSKYAKGVSLSARSRFVSHPSSKPRSFAR